MAASVTTFESAARSFAGLVHRISGDRWDGPGLGAWDLRSLVGHASRSLVTVSTYLQRPPSARTLRPHRITTRGSARSHRTSGATPSSSEGSFVRIARRCAVDDVLYEAVVLAVRIGVATGDGETVLLALTGRAVLPASFSVV